MEQQISTDEVMTAKAEGTMPVSLAPQEGNTTKVSAVIAFFALCIFIGGAFMMLRTERQKSATTIAPNEVLIVSSVSIKYNSISSTPIKMIPQPKSEKELRVYKIGEISEGEYKNKNLVLAYFVTDAVRFDLREDVDAYGYFISDSEGNAVAWNANYIHADVMGYGEEDPEWHFGELLGLTDILQRDLSFLPKEFTLEKVVGQNGQAFTFASPGGLIANIDTATSSVVVSGSTDAGWKIIKRSESTSYYAPSPLPRFTYYVMLPFGKMLEINPEPNFVDENDVPRLTWKFGSSAVASYRYGLYAYGWEDCYESVSAIALPSALVQTGVTIGGDPVTEINASKYPKVYECLHEKTKRYVYDPVTDTGAYKDTVSYADFVPSHPMFFWKNSLGELMAFIRSDVVPSAEKAKPVIYLYPEKNTKVSVSVEPLGGLTITDPEYGNGWVVNATPDGKLTNMADGKKYPYLFWEGGKDGVVRTPKEGFVVARDDIPSVLESKLAQQGLNAKERADFMEFWVPKLSHAPYYFITFITRSEIDRVSPLSVTPKPETIIRVLMDYKPLQQSVAVEPLENPSIERRGFTVVEWGGIVRD